MQIDSYIAHADPCGRNIDSTLCTSVDAKHHGASLSDANFVACKRRNSRGPGNEANISAVRTSFRKCRLTLTLRTPIRAGEISTVICTSVDAKHHGASLSERWNVTWVGQYMYTLNYNSPNQNADIH